VLTIGIQPYVLETAPRLEACLEGWASLRVDPELRDVDAVILRSETKVDGAYIEDRPTLRWVSSATSGSDHIKGPELDARAVRWTSSPGCNAEAVADWVVMALERLWEQPPGTIGIVGVGNAGGAVKRRAEALGWTVLENDPPRAEREPGYVSEPLDGMLGRCDVVTLHVPLDGSTRDLFGAKQFGALRDGALLLNACRGGVMKETAAKSWVAAGGTLGLDVYANEPHPDPEMIAAAALATPHIAGHTAWAKAEGVRRCLVWLAQEVGHDLVSDDVGVAPCDLDAREAITRAAAALRRGEDFKQVRAASVRRRLDPGPGTGGA